MTERTPSTPYSREYSRQTRLVTSRRVKQEETKALRQSLLFGGGALGMIILAIIFIPMLIRFLGGFGGPVVTEEDAVPPQTPYFSAPVEATYSARVALSGFTTPQATVVVLNNGQEATQFVADDSGNFTGEVSLQVGENRLTAFAKNDKLESDVSQEYVTIYDNEEPTLELSTPVDGQTIQGKKDQVTTIEGSTEPQSKLYINDRFVIVNNEGKFSTTHRLEVGENTLRFRVIDRAGNQIEEEIKVSFQE